jgi:hypothetical protein
MFTTIKRPDLTDLVAMADEYRARGWAAVPTAAGVSLVAGDISAVEIRGQLADDVLHYLKVHMLVGPVIEMPGPTKRLVFLTVGSRRAEHAITALRSAGAIVHTDGARVALPPTTLVAGRVRWLGEAGDMRSLPPLVAVSAAVRAVIGRRGVDTALRRAS